MQSKEFFLEKLNSNNFLLRLQRAKLVESLSGGGLVKKIKRLILTPYMYLPYLLIVKAGLYSKKLRTVELFWGQNIKLPIQDYDSLALKNFGFPGGAEAELKLVKFIIKNIKPDDVFYDIGSNFGFYTYLTMNLCKEVHSFEPIKEVYDILEKNTANNIRVKTNNVAVSDKSGTVKLFMSESTGLSTINQSTLGIHTYSYQSDGLTVNSISIDDHVTKNPKPTFMKIDVEGAEELVIDGANSFLTSNSPIIAMEIWGKDNGGEISKKAVKKLRDLGYTSYGLDKDGEIYEVSEDITNLAPKNGGDNFIFKKK